MQQEPVIERFFTAFPDWKKYFPADIATEKQFKLHLMLCTNDELKEDKIVIEMIRQFALIKETFKKN